MKAESVQNFRSVGPSDSGGGAGPSLRCDCRNLTAPRLLLPSHSALSLLGEPLTPSTTLRKYKIHCFFFVTNQKEANKGKGRREAKHAG